jgi:hypothetical protein
VNAGFDKNQTEFGIFILAITLEMLTDSDSLEIISRVCEMVDQVLVGLDGAQKNLFDQHVKILWYLRCEAYHVKVTLSVRDQAEAVSKRMSI